MRFPYYCYSTTKGTFAGESEYAKEKGVFIFYDEDNDIFIDKDGNEVDVSELEIFPRTGVLQAKKLVEAIHRHNARCIVGEGDYDKTLDWPKYISTKRKNVIMSGQEILDNPELIIETFGVDRVFFKTKNKNYSQIIDVEKLMAKEGNFYQAIKAHKDDDFIISDVVDIVHDDSGPLEYRGFVIDGELFTVSRVHDYLMGKVDAGIIKKMQEVIDEASSSDFPKSFVVDVFVCKEDGETYVDVLECNPIVASGTYLYNSVFERNSSLEHDDVLSSIPEEKMKYGHLDAYSLTAGNWGCPSICYELPGGFAADLMSFAFFGSASNGMYFHFDMASNIDPLNIGSDFSMSLVEDENGLCSDEDDRESDDDLIKQLRKKLLDSTFSDNDE